MSEQNDLNEEEVYRALRAIDAGEEVLINYNGYPEGREPLWFEVRNYERAGRPE